MSLFNCPNCKTEAKKLIAPCASKNGMLYCNSCYGPVKKFNNVNLGQTVQKWEGPDGTTHKISSGKAWEMDHRRICKEDKMKVINYATGKETQY